MQQSFMTVRVDPGCLRVGVAPPEFSSSPPSPQLSTSPSWTIDVPNARTIKVTNISPSATANNIKEFFSFSGDIQYVEMRRESETSQVAYVTFKEFHGADTALLLSGASISDVSVNITPVEDYELPPEAYSQAEDMSSPRTPTEAAVKKAEQEVSTMLARGFVLSKDALKRVLSFESRKDAVDGVDSVPQPQVHALQVDVPAVHAHAHVEPAPPNAAHEQDGD